VLLINLSKMTDVYEGSLIRVFRRLEELLRQMAQASKVMGSEELEKKFEESLAKVKRGNHLFLPIKPSFYLLTWIDIVAAASLYL
jgi:superfamily II RNA helicase